MVDELKGVDRGGGGLSPGVPRRRPRREPPKAETPSREAQGDQAQLREGAAQAVRLLAERLESLQGELAVLPPDSPLRGALQDSLAEAQVTMANLLGAVNPADTGMAPEALASAVGALKRSGVLSPGRVLTLLGGAGGRP